jgi:hypothetical protein
MKNATLKACRSLLPGIEFVESKAFYWSPRTKAVHFDPDMLMTPEGEWALLHEAAHAQLGHVHYASDAGLLLLEVEAWQQARRLAEKSGIVIDEDHIQDCLDTYRDWLYARSTCPTCSLNSLQTESTSYQCLNCSTTWSVSRSRFCRPYRMQSRHKKTPSELPRTVFS